MHQIKMPRVHVTGFIYTFWLANSERTWKHHFEGVFEKRKWKTQSTQQNKSVWHSSQFDAYIYMSLLYATTKWPN